MKAIIFDLGGVFLDVDYQKTIQEFSKLKINFDQFTQHSSSDLFKKLETGAITVPQFYDQFRIENNCDLNQDDIKNAWNAMLLDWRIEELKWLKELKESGKYQLYLYSNTNQIHKDCFLSYLDGEFECLFDKVVYSHEFGYRKPDSRSFVELLNYLGLAAQDCLFIDDTLGNVVGASNAGITSIQLISPLKVSELEIFSK